MFIIGVWNGFVNWQKNFYKVFCSIEKEVSLYKSVGFRYNNREKKLKN